MMTTKKVAVIGAGISGLTCAYELKKAGFDVEVFEKEATVGGRMGSRTREGLSFDIGAQMVSRSYDSVLAYCKELGIPEEWTELKGLTHHLYHDNELHLASYGSLGEFLRYSYLPPVTRVRLLAFIGWMRVQARNIDFFDLATGAEHDEKNAYDYAMIFGGKEVADKVVDALVAAYHFHHGREMSMSAFLGCLNHFTHFFTFHQMIRNMSTLPEAFAAKLNVHRGTSITSVLHRKGELLLVGPDRQVHCDIAVLATPGSITQQIYQNPSTEQQALLQKVRYAATINVSYRVPAALLKEVSLVVVPEPDSASIASYLLPQKAQTKTAEESLLNTFLRDHYARKLMTQSNDDIFQNIKRELLAVCPPLRPHADQLIPYDLQRWPEAMPKFLPQYVKQVKSFWQKGQGDHDIYFCGDFLNTPWIEGSVRCGQRVAELVKGKFKSSY